MAKEQKKKSTNKKDELSLKDVFRKVLTTATGTSINEDIFHSLLGNAKGLKEDIFNVLRNEIKNILENYDFEIKIKLVKKDDTTRKNKK